MPVAWALMFLWLVGVNWILAMLNVAFRDLQNLITVILMILLVASPFAYTTAQLPPTVRLVVYLNPFAYFVVAFQHLLMLGRFPPGWQMAVLVVMPITTFALGSWFFSKAKGVLLDYVNALYDELAIRFEQVGKMYKVFGSKLDTALDALNLPTFGRDGRYREFWALRDIDLELARGARLGIIGRNGAGKTTLLKLVTGNLAPTEGGVTVNGDVQALLEIGGGLHPEFTGRENIRASLSYVGLSRAEIEDSEREIAEFTELGRFLDQPFKTYSQGMQARLSFAIATTTQPEILIVDEILGAGDAYFFTRSTARMSQLIESGAGVLLVSHALDQVARFCERTIWLDRGRIAMDGPTDEVIKAYERFIRELEDRRLKAKNEKAALPQYDAFDRETHTDALVGSISAEGGSVEVARVTLWRDGMLEGEIDVGGSQDADTSGSRRTAARGRALGSCPGRRPRLLPRRLRGDRQVSLQPVVLLPPFPLRGGDRLPDTRRPWIAATREGGRPRNDRAAGTRRRVDDIPVRADKPRRRTRAGVGRAAQPLARR